MKYHILRGNSSWLDLIIISPRNPFFGYDDTSIYLPNGTIISHMNYTLIPNGGTNSLLYTSKTFGIFVAVQDISKDNGG